MYKLRTDYKRLYYTYFFTSVHLAHFHVNFLVSPPWKNKSMIKNNFCFTIIRLNWAHQYQKLRLGEADRMVALPCRMGRAAVLFLLSTPAQYSPLQRCLWWYKLSETIDIQFMYCLWKYWHVTWRLVIPPIYQNCFWSGFSIG